MFAVSSLTFAEHLSVRNLSAVQGWLHPHNVFLIICT